MTRHVVIGTAGHVDHGKTALVKRLTGIDTDRWDEEKRRGITIDLGFAPLALGDDLTASIVDVPGHEDFVRNMVAGAAGVDVALLVVAADEGVMPQTVEHLAILRFLGVKTGVAAVSKADLAEGDWLDLVISDLSDRLADSGIHWESPVVVSAVTDQGMDTLRESLANAATRAATRSADDLFRLPIDRVFSVAGAGTVVTGTAWSGSVKVGDTVRVLPGEQSGRVRSVEVHGETRDRAEPGRRTALALVGVNRQAVGRGSVAVVDPSWKETRALDVMITLLPTARALSQRSRVRLHLGTAEVMARVTPATIDIAPGETAAARLRLEQATVARWGDRAVLRSYSPVTTIGGCVVVDPWPSPRPRRPRGLETRAVTDAIARARAFVEDAGPRGLATSELPVRVGFHPQDLEPAATRIEGDGATRVGDILVVRDVVERLHEATLETLAGYHQQHPLEPGMPRELLRAALASAAFGDHVLETLAAEGKILLEGGTARLPSHHASLSQEQTAIGDSVRAALVSAKWNGQTPPELSALAAADEIREVLEFYVRQGTAVRVGRDRYYDKVALDQLRGTVVSEVERLGRATPADLRAITGLSRKYLIPVLEWLDACGLTVREGDARRLGPSARAKP